MEKVLGAGWTLGWVEVVLCCVVVLRSLSGWFGWTSLPGGELMLM